MDRLSAMFDNVPLPWEIVRVRGRELPANFIGTHEGPPIADPIDWLKRNRIRWNFREGNNITWTGMFHGEPLVEDCYIEVAPLLERDEHKHVVWHEIGHAIDYLQEENQELRICRWFYSEKHKTILQRFAPLIISVWAKGNFVGSNDDWHAYASQPRELWAEAVAICCTRPGILMHTDLWPAIAPDLKARHIALPDLPVDELAVLFQ